MSWTDDRVETLTKLWADGLSASQIAAELGGVTRNAVIGKVHRLGLSGRAKAKSPNAARAKRAPRATGYSPRSRVSAKTADGRAIAINTPSRPPIEDMVAPEPKKLSVVELSDKCCRWPYGDPATDDFHFCGHSPKEDSPYCEYHSRLAFQPMADRRREKRAAAS